MRARWNQDGMTMMNILIQSSEIIYNKHLIVEVCKRGHFYCSLRFWYIDNNYVFRYLNSGCLQNFGRGNFYSKLFNMKI